MDDHGWLEGVFGTIRCGNCGAVYGRASISAVGNRDEYWFVRCTCESCSTQGLGVMIVKQVGRIPQPGELVAREDVIRMDDVLEAHELMRNYAGDVQGLFEKVSGG